MKILIITSYKKVLVSLVFMLLITAAIALTAYSVYNSTNIQTTNNSIDSSNELEEISRLRNLLLSIVPAEQKIILEDNDRIVYKNPDFPPPSPLPTSSLSKVISEGVMKKFRILSDDKLYLRPVYDPDWKSTYYRGWLDLPVKNMEARHKIFAFSIGLSMNYDIFGSLGYNPDISVNAHKNINFLIYGFSVESVRVLENQVALIGEPRQTGAQIVSIVQNDLLPEGVDTKDFLFQLSTPEGYEVDFLRYNIIRYEYLMQKIEENTVGTLNPLDESKSLEQLMQENNSLKRELSYFIPLKDEIIYQQNCDSVPGSQPEFDNIQAKLLQGNKIPFSYNYRNPLYKRPLYDPTWKANCERKWCYIPKQIEYSLHRLLIIPRNSENSKDFFGTLGFYEKFQPIKPDQCGLMIYNFSVSDVKLYKDRLVFVGTPTRSGAQIVSINVNILKGYKKYKVSLITPDNSEIDCNILEP